MHAHLRYLHCRPPVGVKTLTLYRWGFTVWLGRWLISLGHDTRSNVVVASRRSG